MTVDILIKEILIHFLFHQHLKTIYAGQMPIYNYYVNVCSELKVSVMNDVDITVNEQSFA